jgi:predicted Rossmann fold flavoprotein
MPAICSAALEGEVVSALATQGGRQIETIFAQWLPRRLAEAITDSLGLAGRRASEISRVDRRRLVDAVKRTQIPVSGTRGFKKAEVTAGGVSLQEIDSGTMQSKIVAGLYLAGEIVDLDGPIGGYNFQAAFSEGWLAGSCV